MYKDFYQKDKGEDVSIAIQHLRDADAVFWIPAPNRLPRTS